MIPAKQQSNDYQSNQCCRLGKRESVLNELARLQPAHVGKCEQGDHDDCEQLRSRQTYRVTAQKGWQAKWPEQIVLCVNAWDQNTGEVSEGHRHRRDGAGLNYHKERPAEKKTG